MVSKAFWENTGISSLWVYFGSIYHRDFHVCVRADIMEGFEYGAAGETDWNWSRAICDDSSQDYTARNVGEYVKTDYRVDEADWNLLLVFQGKQNCSTYRFLPH